VATAKIESIELERKYQLAALPTCAVDSDSKLRAIQVAKAINFLIPLSSSAVHRNKLAMAQYALAAPTARRRTLIVALDSTA